MKKSKVVWMVLMTALVSIGMVSCKKEGCTDSNALNYSSKAKKDDGTCTYPTPDPQPTNTELLTAGIWNFSEVSTTGGQALQNQMDTFFMNSTADFQTNGNLVFNFPNEPTANETKTWEFMSNETQMILDKGTEKEDTIDVLTLNTTSLVIKFIDEDSGSPITVSWKH
ncbi:MAG: hypothetical protein EP338_05810 [Bacteroidetes bacterium]|nr:MAG: hypothetical protein EP338_05810 [Bacteroidota bacterium]